MYNLTFKIIRCLNLKSLATRLVKMQKYCFSASYLLCCTFCSLLQVSHSSEMQIYVPLIDKICLIQQIAIRQEILDSIDLFFINASFKSCISYSYSDFKLHNHSIFAYNEKTRSCSVVYDMPEENTIINCSEHDLQFYKVIHCMPAEGFMYTFEDEVEENVTRISTVKLKATAEICIVERHPFSENFLLKRSGRLFLQSLELCFAHCRVSLVRGNCSAVLFSSDERVCLLLQQNQPLQSTDVMRKSTSQFFTVNYCDYNITETTERRYYNGTGKITNIRIDDRQLQCTVHEIPLLRVHMKHRSLLWKSINFQNCIQFCGQQFQTNLCNAVYFEAEGTTCLHLLLNASQALYEYSENNKETVHFIEKCVEVTVRPELQQESAIYSSQSDEMRTSPLSGEGSSRTYNVSEQATDFFHYVAAENVQEQYVKLYEFLEVCKVQLLNIDVVRNAFTIQVSRKIYSLNRCLHICRRQTTCIAVLFSRLNHQCKKVFQGYSGMSIIVHAHEEVVALKECFKDRPDERKYNSEPLIYYFEETQQICAAEIYKRKNLTSWEVMMINKDISNFQLCLLNCIVNNQCSAINYFQTKECFLIKSAEKNYIFIVKDDSIFAEVLYCESGTLVDESIQMHSYVYIPLFDKVCLIQKYIPHEYPTTSRIPIFIYNSLESCIAACSSYSTGELLCNAFMYSDITKACHLHFYALNLKTGMCPVETGQSQRRLVSESWFAKPISHMTTPNLRKCLSRCVVKGAAACNSVIFSLQERSCTLVAHQSIFSTLSVTVQSSAYFFEIDHCKTKVLEYPLLTSHLQINATSPLQSFYEYCVQHLPITESENATIIDLLSCTTIHCCFQYCLMQRGDFGCNAVFFNDEEKTCLLMKLDVNSSETTDLVLYNFFKGTTRKETLIISNYEDTLRFETSFVSLHEFRERCQILTFTSAYAEHLKVHSLLLQMNSLNGCLTACRNKANDTPSCSGVLFSKQEEVCYKLVEGTSHDQIVTEDDQTIVLLQRCVKDREEERRANSMFYHYHLYELEEMCVFESYKSNHISGFAVYDNILKANSGYQCILKCASEQISKGCAAVHKSRERCLFFRRNSTARIFRKLGSSYFTELLFCESKFAGNTLDFDAVD
ncbi:hypothetical protein T10_7903 [Trichinella papuae]|uniref:Apple domain-containing protein n=1 Tax=Trichinella papuae TaxID=268474 RepID=A0A0V1MYM3_9BILA|nr:hypothetical protein T10_7903 [Trichinella papuae]